MKICIINTTVSIRQLAPTLPESCALHYLFLIQTLGVHHLYDYSAMCNKSLCCGADIFVSVVAAQVFSFSLIIFYAVLAPCVHQCYCSLLNVPLMSEIENYDENINLSVEVNCYIIII